MGYFDDDLWLNFDVFPKVMAINKEVEIHIRDLGGRRVFDPDTDYPAMICAVEEGDPTHFPTTGNWVPLTLHSDAEGNFAFRYTFTKEQMYFIRFLKEDGKRLIQFPVYCVGEDLCGRYPYVGDLHMHTTRSDGRQIPAVVCANYRRHGYDFMVVSDHCRYYPSLEAIDAYKDAPIGLNIVQGEEVHLPEINGLRNDIHIVNFGGEYSVNALVDDSHQVEEVGTDLSTRATRTENVPDVMTRAEFEEKMQALADNIQVPENVERISYAVSCWIFDHIRNGNGLGIFAHPNWIANVQHVPEVLTDYILETQPFDVFEVLGGERYYEHNGFQTQRYYMELAKGHRFPIVGSTDSHSSHPSNKSAFICSTMVFSPENERKALIRSIKDFYSVAIDTIDENFRLVGDFRLSKYASFLLQHYFPLHDELCYEEGRAMKQYVTGTPEEKAEALATLRALAGRVERHRRKYFAF